MTPLSRETEEAMNRLGDRFYNRFGFPLRFAFYGAVLASFPLYDAIFDNSGSNVQAAPARIEHRSDATPAMNGVSVPDTQP